MKIAVLSDAHDNIWNMEKVLPRIQDAGAVIFCGDLCAPFTLKMLAEGVSCPVHCVLGNNDGDVLLLTRIAAQAGNVTLYNPLGELSLDDGALAFTHYHPIAEGLAATGKYRAVFYGHSHETETKRVGDTLLANPGEVMGRFGAASFGIYDTTTGEFALERI